MRTDAGGEHAVPLMERLLPERHHRERTTVAVLVPAPHVVDEEVEPPLFVADPVEQRLDVRVDGMVAPDRDAAAAAFVTSRAVSSIVPGTLSVVGRPSTLRPVT